MVNTGPHKEENMRRRPLQAVILVGSYRYAQHVLRVLDSVWLQEDGVDHIQFVKVCIVTCREGWDSGLLLVVRVGALDCHML